VSVKSADMLDEWQSEAIELATEALKGGSGVDRDVAEALKKEFDRRHPPEWNCIVGKSFGSFVTHESKHFLYFYVNDVGILLFR